MNTAVVQQVGWQALVESTVTGLGYELVECERSAGGLLRVYIDRVPNDPNGEFITVDDCEKVTRQLQYLLEVEGVAYERLEVSSPGLDRPLRKLADYQRFAGHEVDITLKVAFQNRKKYRGVLEAEGDGWRIVFKDGKQDQAMNFSLDEVREARLVPVVDFKGRRRGKAQAADASPAANVQEDGGQES
ncbi:ribosome maturation factor RimP [Aquabacterium sp. A7-Y]|uniref:ribosome maturation factor RimP n=1 Tax=Aquabacterium sp. A7-Y TaxID=1349605 RepID=UPI00223D6A5C|nr:ribosome maturation factor RimP [Aquabacterium sp. A7-Y]MCW7540943.1 ribosome maturation factor RimP [Aquabacterium sp. A7-Y]